jgi:hypothetical protein
MYDIQKCVGASIGLAVSLAVSAASHATPNPSAASSLRAIDIDLDLPDLQLEIYGFSPVGPVVVTAPAVSASTATVEVDDAQGPMVKAFVLAETDSGATGCRWIAGWADVTARGVFRDAGNGTLADASGLGDAAPRVDIESSSLPRWYLALRPR